MRCTEYSRLYVNGGMSTKFPETGGARERAMMAMLSLTRVLRPSPSASLVRRAPRAQCLPIQQIVSSRRYASKKAKGKGKDEPSAKPKPRDGGDKYTHSTASLVPGSQKAVSDAAQAEYMKCEERMHAAVEWFRKECASLEGRASGRVTPALLAPIRVSVPGIGEGMKVEELATVGVKDGSMLVVTLFEEGVSALISKGAERLIAQRWLVELQTCRTSYPHRKIAEHCSPKA
jgi:hypothetical protein